MTVAVNEAAMLGGPAVAGVLKLTTIGVPCTSMWFAKGSPIGTLSNAHLTLGWRIPGVLTLIQPGSCAGICPSQGTQPAMGSHLVSFWQSLSVLQGVFGTQVPCEQTWVMGSQGMVQPAVPPIPEPLWKRVPPAPPWPELPELAALVPVLF